MKRLSIIIIASAMAVAISVCSLTAIKANAQTPDMIPPVTTYDSIKIQSGDTLEAIAREYNTEDYYTNSEYIAEVMRINNLSSDNIHAGCYLTVLSF